ncbi:cilia- and flagella-associated protein 91-like [Tachysurus ichikawai]
MKVHQATVDLYLEDVILHSIDKTAEAQAREEIHQFAEELNNITYAMEEMRNNEQSEEIVAQLVYSFLIPEVQKVTARERVKQSQRRHLHAAHALIHDTDSSSTSHRHLSPTSRASTSLLSQIVEQVEEASHNSDRHQENEHTD